MKKNVSLVRWSALSLAIASAFPAHSQTELKEVLVTATRFEEIASDLAQGVSTLAQADIQRSGVQSVPEALMRLLGVVGKVDLSGGGNYALDLRGFGETADSNQVVIVDGRRLNEGDMTKANLAAIPIDSVQSIEVLRGSSAVLYGEGATAGAIVITTRSGRGIQKPNGATVSYGAGSFGMRDTRLGANVGAGSWQLDVAAQDRSSDGYRQNFGAKQNALSGTVQWSDDWMRAGVQMSSTEIRSGLPGSLTLAEYNEDASRVGSSGSLTDWGKTKNESAAVFWQGLTDLWEFGADVTQRNRKLQSVNYGLNVYTVEGNAYNLRAKRKYEASALVGSLAMGLEVYDWVRQSSMAYGSADTSRSKTENQAFFALAQLRAKSVGTSVELGYRQESVKKTKSTFIGSMEDMPRAWHFGVNQAFAKDWRAFGRLGSSYRLGNIDEVFPYGGSSVSNLAIQVSRDTEVGLAWGRALQSAQLRIYRHTVRNEIAYDGSKNVNLDPTEHRGVELEARAQVTSALSLRTSLASRQNVFSEGSSAGRETYLTPRHSAAVWADYLFSTEHLWSLGATSVSSQFVDQANSCSVPAYTTVDARYVFRKNRFELSLAINNLTDRKYYTYAYDCASGIYPEAGRNIQANVKYQF